MTKTKKHRDSEREEAREFLRSRVQPGAVVYTVLVHNARSGLARKIKLLTMIGENADARLCNISWWAACALGWKVDRDTMALVVEGCGMDMGYNAVYMLGRTLWPDGTPSPHGSRNGEPDHDGGYALKHEWI